MIQLDQVLKTDSILIQAEKGAQSQLKIATLVNVAKECAKEFIKLNPKCNITFRIANTFLRFRIDFNEHIDYPVEFSCDTFGNSRAFDRWFENLESLTSRAYSDLIKECFEKAKDETEITFTLYPLQREFQS